MQALSMSRLGSGRGAWQRVLIGRDLRPQESSLTSTTPMQPLAPEYLAEISRQLATLSAFLGGFAAAFLGTLLGLASARWQTAWAAGAAAISAASFIATVVAATMIAVVLHPAAPQMGSRAA